MPIFEQGYSALAERPVSRGWRGWPIFYRALMPILKRRLILIVLFMAWLPMLIKGAWLLVAQLVLGGQIALPQSMTHEATSVDFVGYVEGQAFWVMVLVAFVGSGLVARDLQSGAVKLYLSKPITRLDYLLGKWSVLGAFIGVITLIPGVLLLLIHAVAHKNFALFLGTALPGVVAVGLGYMLVGGAVMLALSSLTVSPRMAAIAWLGLFIIGEIAATTLARTQPGWWPQCFMLERVVHSLGELVVGGTPRGDAFDRALPAGVALGMSAALIAVSLAVVWRRLSEVRRT